MSVFKNSLYFGGSKNEDSVGLFILPVLSLMDELFLSVLIKKLEPTFLPFVVPMVKPFIPKKREPNDNFEYCACFRKFGSTLSNG